MTELNSKKTLNGQIKNGHRKIGALHKLYKDFSKAHLKKLGKKLLLTGLSSLKQSTMVHFKKTLDCSKKKRMRRKAIEVLSDSLLTGVELAKKVCSRGLDCLVICGDIDKKTKFFLYMQFAYYYHQFFHITPVAMVIFEDELTNNNEKV